jgi:glyoxylase I family protein
MEKVTRIGGLFFRAHDPVGLAGWYREHLGITPVPSDSEQSGWRQEAGATGFVPFPDCHGLLWGIQAGLDGQLSRAGS